MEANLDQYTFDANSAQQILPSEVASTNDNEEESVAGEENEQEDAPIKKRERKQRKRKKAPNAPRRAKSAYIIFFQAHREEYKAQLPPDSKQADVMRAVAAKWAVMSEDDKKEWHDKAEEEKQRYETEKAAYDGPMYISNKKKRGDPEAPKRAMSAFLHYSQKRRAVLQKENPSATNTELSKMLGQEWANMPDDVKAPYVAKARADNEKYKESMIQYHAQKRLKEDAKNVTANAIAAAQAQAHQALLESFNANAAQQHAFGGVGVGGGIFPGQYPNMGQAWINNAAAAAAAANYPNMFHEMMQYQQQLQLQQQQQQQQQQHQHHQAQQQQQMGLSDLMNSAYGQYYQT